MGLLKLFKSTLRKKIIKAYYRDYPEIPYISEERKVDWLDQASMFPQQSIIPKSMMTRFDDGLLPGHVYMLYWLGKYTNKKVPVYFEYKYGVDFEKEKAFLIDNGFLDRTSKPTPKGEEAIKRHYYIVENHAPKKPKPEELILMQKESMKRNGFKHYIIVPCKDACEVCKDFSRKYYPVSKMEIGKNAPPFHEGCRCSVSAYEDPVAYEKRIKSLLQY